MHERSLLMHSRSLNLVLVLKIDWNLVLRGSRERLTPVLMTALSAGLALMPLLIGADEPGRNVEVGLNVRVAHRCLLGGQV